MSKVIFLITEDSMEMGDIAEAVLKKFNDDPQLRAIVWPAMYGTYWCAIKGGIELTNVINSDLSINIQAVPPTKKKQPNLSYILTVNYITALLDKGSAPSRVKILEAFLEAHS